MKYFTRHNIKALEKQVKNEIDAKKKQKNGDLIIEEIIENDYKQNNFDDGDFDEVKCLNIIKADANIKNDENNKNEDYSKKLIIIKKDKIEEYDDRQINFENKQKNLNAKKSLNMTILDESMANDKTQNDFDDVEDFNMVKGDKKIMETNDKQFSCGKCEEILSSNLTLKTIINQFMKDCYIRVTYVTIRLNKSLILKGI